MLSNEEQSLKARLPIFFSPFPLSEKVMVFRLEAPSKAKESTRSTLDGKEREVSCLSLKNAFSEIAVKGIPSRAVSLIMISVPFV